MTLPHSKDIMKYPARFQFQSGAPCGGSSTCTDTCIQMIVEYYKDKTYSLSYIRKVAQSQTHFNESPCTGINYIEALNALKLLGVTHYRVGFGMTFADVIKKVAIGPTIVGVWYADYPNWRGHCATHTNHAEIAGRTQCGFFGAHAILALKKAPHIINGKYNHMDVFSRDPDHHSSARPEHPNHDRIKLSHLNKAMLALPEHTRFSKTYMIYPTRRK